jgi:hypothetical protein
MPRIAWIEDANAQGDLAASYDEIRSTQGSVPDILRAMSLRPDFLAAVNQMGRMHFSDGALTRAQHEMIASYVSVLNRCHF